MPSTPAGESPPPIHSPSPILGPAPGHASSPVPGPAPIVGPPQSEPAPPRRRPFVVTLAVLLMVPSVVTWLIAGIGFFRAMMKAEGDGLGRFLVVGIGAAVLALALLVVFLASIGVLMAWTGDNAQGLAVPAGFTFGLFVVVIVTLLMQGKLSYHPTMVTPLVVGGLAGVSLALIKSPPARTWFAARRR
ncbi:hypothetical protein Vqi01_47960 [Micromonospora qiuiae]|uniref:DUF4190 domain-containing protein n=1 Tax=Micromonospora qiuiae TaxID=502268 RepID=A0ABQ4JJD9_9ACTN|nr:hypothetical protein [Micromonospora qiuiae]GIJ29634.1 hypothetical protein Vqi01_47960 [Micromonospora qiuiae]